MQHIVLPENRPSAVNIINANVVTPTEVLAPGGLHIESGRIVDIWSGTRSYSGPDTLDAKGLFLFPGFVDIHADALEMAIAPRPAAPFTPAAVLPSYDTLLAMHGITTVYHCVGLADLGDFAKPLRTRAAADEIIVGIQDFASYARVRTKIHLRYEITDTSSLPLVFKWVAKGRIHLVSLMDHTPGYGVFKDIDAYRDYFRRSGLTMEAADAKFAVLQKLRSDVDEGALANLVRTCLESNLTVVSHDDHTAEKLQWAIDLGLSVAEFPVTMAAVDFARANGMQTVFGAPNLIRGNSHAGNLRVADLIMAGKVDILCQDYAPLCLLPALFKSAEIMESSLAEASRLFSLYPAQSVGLDDVTGSIETGKFADLILVDNRPPVPGVVVTFVEGRLVYQTTRSKYSDQQTASVLDNDGHNDHHREVNMTA